MVTQCKHCCADIEFEAPIVGLKFDIKPTICDECNEKIRTAQLAKEERARLLHFEAICPPVYRETSMNHPSMPSPAKQAQILNWRGPRGLLLYGKPRTCKTRMAWLAVRAAVLSGASVAAHTSIEFANRCSAAFGDPETYCDFIDDLVHVDVLLLDDLGKEKLTERVESSLFHVVETRCANRRPMVITTNYVGSLLIERMSPDRGGPFVERLRDYFDPINL